VGRARKGAEERVAILLCWQARAAGCEPEKNPYLFPFVSHRYSSS
jgi:hypothetical protein